MMTLTSIFTARRNGSKVAFVKQGDYIKEAWAPRTAVKHRSELHGIIASVRNFNSVPQSKDGWPCNCPIMSRSVLSHMSKSEAIAGLGRAMEPVARCPACGSAEGHPVHEALSDRVFFCAPGEWNLVRCDHCGSGYLNPRPGAETLAAAYSAYYTHGDASGVSEPPRSAWRKYRSAQRNAYLNARYG